jgi:hypothetical protein
MSLGSLPLSEVPAYDPRTATRPQTTHAVVRLLQSIRRTEKNTGLANCAWRTDRIPHSREFLQGEARTKESACHVLCRERGRSRDFWHCPNHNRPKRSGAGLPRLLEVPPVADGNCDRTSSLDRDAVQQASGRPSPARRPEPPGGIDRSFNLNSETTVKLQPHLLPHEWLSEHFVTSNEFSSPGKSHNRKLEALKSIWTVTAFIGT